MPGLRSIALTAALLLGALALAIGVAGQFGRVSPRLDVVNHFAPLTVAAGIGALILSLAAPAGNLRLIATICACIATVLSAAQMAPELYAAATQKRVAAGTDAAFKIIQFNAWGRNEEAEQAARWILSQEAHAVVLQEPGRIAEILVRQGAYHRSCAGCGVIVLTRAAPLRVWPVDERGNDNPYLTAATIEHRRRKVTIVGVHRHWPIRLTRDRVSTARLNQFLATQRKSHLIVAGDFNSTPWSFARRREDREWGLIRRTRALFTWPAAQVSHNRLPAPFPYLPIDHVYAGPGWATVKVERGPELGSDHYPVIVTLVPAEGAAR